MTKGYRQKILNWYCSAGLISLFGALAPAMCWFVYMDWVNQLGGPISFVNVAGPLGESLLVYAVLFLPVAVWHIFDLLQIGKPKSRFGRIVIAYFNFVIAVAATGLVLTLGYSGLFDPNRSRPPNSLEALSPVPFWLTVITYMLLLLLTAICLAKGAMALNSRRKIQK